MSDGLLTDQEVMAKLKVKDLRTLLAWVEAGDIPGLVMGSIEQRRGPKNRRWRWEDFDEKFDRAKLQRRKARG